MRNVREMNIELQNIFSNLKNDKIDRKKAAEMNNTAGKILLSVRTQLLYAFLRGEKPDVEFLNVKKLKPKK